MAVILRGHLFDLMTDDQVAAAVFIDKPFGNSKAVRRIYFLVGMEVDQFNPACSPLPIVLQSPITSMQIPKIMAVPATMTSGDQ